MRKVKAESGLPRRRLAAVAVGFALLAIVLFFREPLLVFFGQLIERIDPGGGEVTFLIERPLDVLLRVVSAEPDWALRREWQEAIRRGRRLVKTDRSLEYSAPHDRHETGELQTWLLTCLAKNSDEDREFTRRLAKRLAKSESQPHRQVAFTVLAQFFPHDDEVHRLLAELVQSESDVNWMRRPLRFVSLSHPRVYAELLKDGPMSRVLALWALHDRYVQALPESYPQGDNQTLVQQEKQAADTAGPEVVEFAQRVAAEFLSSDASIGHNASIYYLTYCPNGGHYLVQAAASAPDASLREQIALALARVTENTYFKRVDFQFSLEEGDHVVGLLLDPDAKVRAAAAKAVNFGIPPDPNPKTAFRHGSGPTNPQNIEVFRELLDRYPGENDSLALNYFHRIGPFEEVDIPRIISAIRRGMTGQLTVQVVNAYKDLRAKYPDHQATTDFIRDHSELR